MSEFINVASTLGLPIQLTEPVPNPDKPGEAPPLRSVTIGGRHHVGIGGATVTRGINADVYHKWVEANPYHPAVTGEHMCVVSDEEADALDDPAMSFGFEPGLDAVVKADDGAMAAGSEAGDKPAADVDMAAHSDAPNDDSPRSQTTASGPAE